MTDSTQTSFNAPTGVPLAGSDSAPEQSPKYFYLQDSRGLVGDNLMFWAQAGGYTSSLGLAELMTEDKAFNQHESRHTDIPWSADYLSQRTRPVVDMQYVKSDQAVRDGDRGQPSSDYAWTEKFCRSKPRDYIGNDMLFEALDGTYTTDLTKVRLYSKDEMMQHAERYIGVFWPQSYLMDKSRLAVDHKQVRLKDALKDATRQLVVVKKPHTTPQRCHSCGIFLKKYNFDCRCGADNRP